MKRLAICSWALNVLLALVYFHLAGKSDSSGAPAAARPAVLSPALPGPPSSLPVAGPTEKPQPNFMAELHASREIALPRSLALHYRYIGTGSVVHCITALLLPGNRTETLDILRLEGSHREQINAAIRQASDGMLEALLKGASLTNPGPDRSQLNVQLKSEDLTRLRS